MKNYLAIFMGSALAVAAFASCSKLNENPVFDAKESFVAFDQISYSVPERKDTATKVDDTLYVSVSIAAYQPVKTNVAYKIIDNAADTTYKAKEGVDFVDTNPDKVLLFNGKEWTKTIALAIKEHRGEFTGDKSFAIQIVSASGLKLSAENLTEVTITDNDHPLSEMLGKYTVTSKNYMGTGSLDKYTLTISKDSKELDVVWIDYIVPGALTYASWGDWSYVGTVSGEKGARVITIARGQKTVSAWYTSTDDLFELYTYDSCDGSNINGMTNKGSFEMKQTDGAATVTFSTELGIWLVPCVNQTCYTTFAAVNPVWTKQ